MLCTLLACIMIGHINHAFNLSIFDGNVRIMLAAKLTEFCFNNLCYA